MPNCISGGREAACRHAAAAAAAAARCLVCPSALAACPAPPAAAASPSSTPNSNFLRGVKWSPDGACLMTASDDNRCGGDAGCCGWTVSGNLFRLRLLWLQHAKVMRHLPTSLPCSLCSLRIYDTPLEAFQLASPEAAAAGTAAGGSAAGEPEAAGQRVPAQPPAAAAGQQQAGGGRDSLAPALRIQEGELLYDWCW